jgi:YD repeat-containing protein
VAQCDTGFSDDANGPGRRKSITRDSLNRVVGCIIRRREVTGGPAIIESDVAYTLDLEGRRLSATGGDNPGQYFQESSVPPGDHQMSQYTKWPGGGLEWDDQGCLTTMSRSTGASRLVYDAASRLVAVHDAATGQPVANYAYDGMGRRTRSTTGLNDPLVPPVDVFFVYDGAICVQELGGDGKPNFTLGAVGVGPCISTRNGTILYPHGGGNSGGGGSTARFNYPILHADMQRLELKPEEDVELTVCRMGRPAINTALTGAFFTDAAGAVTERLDGGDAGFPVFLTGEGLPRPGATDTLTGFRWLSPDCIWCPESRFIQRLGSVYSPELGTGVSAHKQKPKPKPEPRPANMGWDLATAKKV